MSERCIALIAAKDALTIFDLDEETLSSAVSSGKICIYAIADRTFYKHSDLAELSNPPRREVRSRVVRTIPPSLGRAEQRRAAVPCPGCGGRNLAVSSTKDKLTFIRRIYQCLNEECRTRFSTIETISEDT